jgi:hypothetical protein
MAAFYDEWKEEIRPGVYIEIVGREGPEQDRRQNTPGMDDVLLSTDQGEPLITHHAEYIIAI